MKLNPEHQQAVQVFASIAKLATQNLAVEHYYNQVVAQIPNDLWQRIIGNSPTWFDFYFQTPMDAFTQMMKSPSAAEAFKTEGNSSEPFAMFEEIAVRGIAMASETVSLAQGFLSRDGSVELADEDVFTEEFIQELALFKSLSAETRARATYGQGMLALVDAGKRGNNEGYFRAVTMDVQAFIPEGSVEWEGRNCIVEFSSIGARLIALRPCGENDAISAVAKAPFNANGLTEYYVSW